MFNKTFRISILHFEVALVSTSISWCSQRHRAIPDRPIIPFFLVYGRKSSDWENHQRVGIICGVLIKSTANSLIKAGYVWEDTISVSSQLSIKIQVCICCRYLYPCKDAYLLIRNPNRLVLKSKMLLWNEWLMYMAVHEISLSLGDRKQWLEEILLRYMTFCSL